MGRKALSLEESEDEAGNDGREDCRVCVGDGEAAKGEGDSADEEEDDDDDEEDVEDVEEVNVLSSESDS